MRRSLGSLALAFVVSAGSAAADEPGAAAAGQQPAAAGAPGPDAPPPAAAPADAPPPTAAPADASAIPPAPGAADPPAAPKPSDHPAWQPIPTSDEKVLWALALQGHGLFVPGFLLAPFLKQYSTLNSGGFALQGIRRKGTLDIALTLDFSFYTPSDGNWLGANKDPTVDTHYTHFSGLNFLSLDVAFLYTHDLASWIAIQVGGGVGLGVVFGDIWAINAADKTNMGSNAGSASDCANFGGDTSRCFPHGYDNGKMPSPGTIGDQSVYYTDAQGRNVPVGDIKPSDPDFQKKLDATTASQAGCKPDSTTNSCLDTAQHPYYHKTSDKPPVLPVINFIVGFKLKLHRHFNFNISGGFRNGFVVNGGPEYVF